MMSKTEMRKHVASLLKNLPLKEKQVQSKLVYRRLITHPKYMTAERLSIYLSTENEIDTIPILKQALEKDRKQCFIPLVWRDTSLSDNETRMVMIELNSMKDYEDLPLNKYGIKEPNDESCFELKRSEATKNCLDLIIVPGVAFTQDGRRLGHGKGYYDEFLINWNQKATKPLYSIGLAFNEQIVDNLPTVEGCDVKLDEIVFIANPPNLPLKSV